MVCADLPRVGHASVISASLSFVLVNPLCYPPVRSLGQWEGHDMAGGFFRCNVADAAEQKVHCAPTIHMSVPVCIVTLDSNTATNAENATSRIRGEYAAKR